jgi:hypothetical protein
VTQIQDAKVKLKGGLDLKFVAALILRERVDDWLSGFMSKLKMGSEEAEAEAKGIGDNGLPVMSFQVPVLHLQGIDSGSMKDSGIDVDTIAEGRTVINSVASIHLLT